MCLWAIFIFPGMVHIFPCSRIGRRSWKYINLSQIYECRNWETEHYNSVLEITVSFPGIHKWEPDIYIRFSPALHLQCTVSTVVLTLHWFDTSFSMKGQNKERKTSSTYFGLWVGHFPGMRRSKCVSAPAYHTYCRSCVRISSQHPKPVDRNVPWVKKTKTFTSSLWKNSSR